MRHFFSHCSAIGSYCWNASISVRAVIICLVLFSSFFFLLGNFRSPDDFRRLQEDMDRANQRLRLFAGELSRRNGYTSHLLSRVDGDKRALTLLGNRIDELMRENQKIKKKLLFYQYMTDNSIPADELSIQSLSFRPEGDSQQWRLEAILVYLGVFEGSYYVEIELANAESDKVLRYPADNQALHLNFYHTVEEQVTLPAVAAIKNVRLVVVNKRNQQVALAEINLLSTSE